MASLTETAMTSRKVVRYGIYLVILIIIARFTYNTAVKLYHRYVPPKPEKPTLAFGNLPVIPFPDEESPTNLTYKLETIDGQLPKLIDQTPVYYIPPIEPGLQSLEIAKSKAKKLGFNPNGEPIVETIPNVYIFRKAKKPSTLTMNIVSGIFSISYDTSRDSSVFMKQATSPDSAISSAKSKIKNASSQTADLSDAPATAELLRYTGGSLVPAISLSEANVVKVNIFRNKLGKNSNIPSVTHDMPESNIWFLFGGGEIIAAEYHHYPLNLGRSGTYPLITSEKAWERLEKGEAFVTNLGENESGQITIRKVYLAYYDPGLYTEYYQPVVVFGGDNNFYAYVPAILDNYYGK